MSDYFPIPYDFPVPELRGLSARLATATGVTSSDRYSRQPLDAPTLRAVQSANGYRLAAYLFADPGEHDRNPIFVYVDLHHGLYTFTARKVREAFAVSDLFMLDQSVGQAGKIVPWLVTCPSMTPIKFDPGELLHPCLPCTRTVASPVALHLKQILAGRIKQDGPLKNHQIPVGNHFVLVNHPEHGQLAVHSCEMAVFGFDPVRQVSSIT